MYSVCRFLKLLLTEVNRLLVPFPWKLDMMCVALGPPRKLVVYFVARTLPTVSFHGE